MATLQGNDIPQLLDMITADGLDDVENTLLDLVSVARETRKKVTKERIVSYWHSNLEMPETRILDFHVIFTDDWNLHWKLIIYFT